MEGEGMGRMWAAHGDEVRGRGGGLQGTGLCLFRKMSSIHHKPLWMLPFAGHCSPSITPLLFSEGKGPGFHHWNLCIFLAITFFNYWLKVNTQPLFTQAKHRLFRRREKKKPNQLARFQAPSLSICKRGLIWVSKHKAKVPITHRGTFLRSNRLVITHLRLLELCNTERPVMGNEWHDSKWERRKPSMPSSIPQLGGQHWMNHHRVQAFPGSMCYCETFCWAGCGESVWVHALTARQCWIDWSSEVKTEPLEIISERKLSAVPGQNAWGQQRANSRDDLT